ncbi:hypothetical protein [Halorubrum sp. Atlit-28R]|jgi:hypothetical protein|uniref:hypothetical protein n=1 Tax=Halorubrum sp. Atlit-28R TaxID=2282129 RepID=UPI000EF28632|nr:hypothetical protein [Halorubrum sp. Atlit-28R]RLM49758.1 hypothetical protein DVK06_13315 [Halorubrum sp. Atlit-28R]
MRCSRRSALRPLGVAAATAATAGCLNAGDPDVLAIADDLEPIDGYDERVDFRNAVVEYRDAVYRFDLIVTP